MLIEDIITRNNHILVVVDLDPQVQEDIYVGATKKALRTETELYYGKTLADQENYVIFNRLAGYPTPIKDKYVKVIPEDLIIAKMNVKDKVLVPTKDRVLIRMKKSNVVSEDGVYNDETLDPREQATAKGVVIATGPLVTNLPEGSIARFDPWCATEITDVEDNEMLVMILENDISFYTK